MSYFSCAKFGNLHRIYSENGEPYLLWKANTTEQSATFRGQQGVSYKFIVTARDKDGNYEAVEESKAVKVTY